MLSIIIYYSPSGGIDLQNIATDIGYLLEKATGLNYTIKSFASGDPIAYGIYLLIDNVTTGFTKNSSCKVQSNGITYLKFNAPLVQGLEYGSYQYLEEELGFRFYLPETHESEFGRYASSAGYIYPEFLWTKIPALRTPYKLIDKYLSPNFIYKSYTGSAASNYSYIPDPADRTKDQYLDEFKSTLQDL